jgi:hypothetical protein
MMTFLKKYRLIILVCIAVLLRLVIAATTYHPDLRAAEFASFTVVEMGSGWRLYDVLPNLPPDDPIYKALGPTELNYPPLAWLAPSVFRLILRPLMNPQVDLMIMTNVEKLFGTTQLMWHLVLLKLPLLTADLLVAWLLTFYFSARNKKTLVFLLWLFNPLTLYATFAVGQIDIWPVLTTVAAGIFLIKNRPVFACFLLGVGGGYKLFPLLLLLPTVLLFGQNIKEKIKLIGVGLGTYLLIIFPFVLTSPGYRAYSLATPQIDKMLFAKIMVSGDQYISLFVVGLLVICAFSSYTRRAYWSIYWSVMLLLLFSVTHYHPQWFLWLTPWLILFVVKKGAFWLYALALIAADIGITLSFDASLHYGLLGPIFPWIANAPYLLPQLVSRYLPFATFVSLIRSALAAISIATAFHLYENRSEYKV